ncbi:hypothetical protein Q8A67_000415 [Cirrhinus molitorella]|uniref:Uncharacterized protein n=1 Tax=Cirrhinus molitorella TaxID=172907 RepID=A0AA88Q9Q8_9TELE|nr:hypothetical protein Q8A67_000415 [Cirrhinus molitorella]
MASIIQRLFSTSSKTSVCASKDKAKLWFMNLATRRGTNTTQTTLSMTQDCEAADLGCHEQTTNARAQLVLNSPPAAHFSSGP